MSNESIEPSALMECVTHLPFAMAHFFICLHQGNLTLANLYLLCEADRLAKFETVYQAPMPQKDWTRLRAYAVEMEVPGEFFIEEPYRFSEDLRKINALRDAFSEKVQAWVAAERAGNTPSKKD